MFNATQVVYFVLHTLILRFVFQIWTPESIEMGSKRKIWQIEEQFVAIIITFRYINYNLVPRGLVQMDEHFPLGSMCIFSLPIDTESIQRVYILFAIDGPFLM